MRTRGFVLLAIVGYLAFVAPSYLAARQAPGATADTPSPNVPASQAVPVQSVGSPASPTHAPDQIMWALIVSYLFQYAKTSNWKAFSWMNTTSSDRFKAQIGFLAAVFTAAGIHFAVTGSVLDGGGASITVTGVSLDALKDVAFQWASQQAWFDAIVHRRV